MKKFIHKSNERGSSNLGWLKSKFSFSFANYYNPKRMGFGKLRVLNDDIISPDEGFDTHHHDNMEIITIPLEGELIHEDSTGSKEVITKGQIQVMSAGSGILHSEFNYSKKTDLKLFQIWIETNKRNVKPRHKTKTLNLKKNELNKIVSGNEQEKTLFIHQDASLYLAEFDKDKEITYETKKERGTFIMIIEGSSQIENEKLSKRDSIEITDTNKITIKANKNSKILLIDILF